MGISSIRRFHLSVAKPNILLLDITIIRFLSLLGMLLLFTAFADIYCYFKNYTLYLTVGSVLKWAYFLMSTVIVDFFCQNIAIPVSFSKNKY